MAERASIGARAAPIAAIAAVTLAISSTTAAAALDFAPKQDIAVGDGPTAVAVGDFNEDRRPDLAVANSGAPYSPGNVAVLLGDGMGAFGPPSSVPTGGDNPYSVAVGDFNGDGHQDLAVADLYGMSNFSSTDTYASVLMGDGTGAFTRGATFLVTSGLANPSSVTVADLNGDGRHDLVFGGARYRSSSSAWEGVLATLLGDASGGFPDTNPMSVSAQVRAAAAADLNRDGRADVVTAMSGREDFPGMAAAWQGNGTGAFENPASWIADAGPGSTSVAVGDFNADGNPDLAVANYGSDDVSVFMGDGTGSFAGPTPFGAGNGPRSVAVGDFDGDGRQDLAVANAESLDVSILVGTGSGAFAAPIHLATGERATFVTNRVNGDGGIVRVGDFDCNGTHDLAIANSVSGTVSVLMNARPGARPPGCLPPDTAVDGSASAKKIQLQPPGKVRVRVKVAASESVAARWTGKLRLGTKAYRLKAVAMDVAAGRRATATLKPRRRRDETKLVKALSRGKRVKAKVTVKLTDAAGNTRSATVKATLKRRPA